MVESNRCVSGEDAIAFFDGLSDVVPEQDIETYTRAMNRLRHEVSKSVPVPPRVLKQRYTTYNCGACNAGLQYWVGEYCTRCGRKVDWSAIKGGK